MKLKARLVIFFIALVCIGCQTHVVQRLPTAAPVGKTQILITFGQQGDSQVLRGGSKRAYLSNSSWGVPLYLQERIDQLEKQFEIQQQIGWQMDSIDVHCIVFLVDAGRDINTLITTLRGQPDVDDAQLMQEFSAMSTPLGQAVVYDDSHLVLQYGDFVDQLSRLHTVSRGKAVTVGVIDTRSDLDHPDLHGQIKTQTVFVESSSERENNIKQLIQHGTAVVGIITARANNGEGIVGLAPESELHLYAACDSNGTQRARCNTFNVLQALEQAIKDKVQVLNLSIAGPRDRLIERVINVAVDEGMIVIAAVNSTSEERNFPASMKNVVAVKEVTAEYDSQRDLFGDWLVRSEKLSTLSGGGYQFFNGSSISTASMSGIAAVYRANATTSETKSFIEGLASGRCKPHTQRTESSTANDSLLDVIKISNTCQQ